MNKHNSNNVVWEPVQEQPCGLARLYRATGTGSYPELLQAVANDPVQYWRTALDDLNLTWDEPFGEIWNLDRGKMWPTWFPDARFNFVTNALYRHVENGRADHTAVIWEGDDGASTSVTYAELANRTNQAARAMQTLGIRPGDRVAIYLSMCIEAVVALLACGAIGAVSVPLFSGYGPDAIATRIEVSGAKLLVTIDSFTRRGKRIATKVIADEALLKTPSVARCLVVQRSDVPCAMKGDRDVDWAGALAAESTAPFVPDTAADDPAMLLFTSGTTGKPKGAVHIQAGFPIKAVHDLTYCFDLTPNDVLFWYTDLGWMMGPWLIAGGLMTGATIVLFEGVPDFPDVDRLWSIIERYQVSIFGVAPTAIRALMPHGTEPVHRHDLSSLRVLGSTGETWNPDPWRWYFEQVGGGRCPIINYSGGTEISGGIVSGYSSLSMKPGSFSGPVPGMVADVVDEVGNPVRGAVGELVIREPFVGMTNGFWNEPDRYEDAYWNRIPDCWVHGDFAEVDDDGFWFIRGRSDDTINVAGKRIGPAEIESAAVGTGLVREAAAIAVPHHLKGDVVYVFAIPSDTESGAEVADQIRMAVGSQLGGSLRPERVVFVQDLPRTRNAKIMRRVIRAAWLDRQTGDLSSLENPDAVEAIRNLRGLV